MWKSIKNQEISSCFRNFLNKNLAEFGYYYYFCDIYSMFYDNWQSKRKRSIIEAFGV